jgi:HMG (high mobility group) box
LSESERERYHELARRDKARYEAESKTYGGPWKVKVDTLADLRKAGAPKRPSSAFLLYMKAVRPSVSQQRRDLCGDDLTRLIATQWKSEATHIRQPYIDESNVQQKIYQNDMAKWRKENPPESYQIPASALVASQAQSKQRYETESTDPRPTVSSEPASVPVFVNQHQQRRRQRQKRSQSPYQSERDVQHSTSYEYTHGSSDSEVDDVADIDNDGDVDGSSDESSDKKVAAKQLSASHDERPAGMSDTHTHDDTVCAFAQPLSSQQTYSYAQDSVHVQSYAQALTHASVHHYSQPHLGVSHMQWPTRNIQQSQTIATLVPALATTTATPEATRTAALPVTASETLQGADRGSHQSYNLIQSVLSSDVSYQDLLHAPRVAHILNQSALLSHNTRRITQNTSRQGYGPLHGLTVGSIATGDAYTAQFSNFSALHTPVYGQVNNMPSHESHASAATAQNSGADAAEHHDPTDSEKQSLASLDVADMDDVTPVDDSFSWT